MIQESEYHISNEVQAQERELIELAKKDMKHFAPLYDKYYEQIFNYCYQRLNTKEEAFDVTAQVFLKAMTNLKKYKHQGLPFTSWLYRIAKSELGNEFRSQSKNRTINLNDNHIKDLFYEVKAKDNNDEQRNILVRALERLSDGNLLVIEMRFFEKRSFKEIGEILEITENNAKVKLYRALDKLRAIFKSQNLTR